jgi:biopolymer transport protein ExbD
LHVTPVGEYSVNGKAVTASQLAAELATLKPQHGRFAIGFQAAASAPQDAVQHAMSTAQQLGATVSVVGNEKF